LDLSSSFFFLCHTPPPDIYPSFPTRRSSDLGLKKWSPTTRSGREVAAASRVMGMEEVLEARIASLPTLPSRAVKISRLSASFSRSEEHTSELQSRENLVCRLLLEKKKAKQKL